MTVSNKVACTAFQRTEVLKFLENPKFCTNAELDDSDVSALRDIFQDADEGFLALTPDKTALVQRLVVKMLERYRALRGPTDMGWQYAAARRSFDGLNAKLAK